MEMEKPEEVQTKQQDIQEEQKVAEKTDGETSTELSEKALPPVTYSCKSCRKFLFPATEIVDHNSGIKKFKTTTKKKFVSFPKNRTFSDICLKNRVF